MRYKNKFIIFSFARTGSSILKKVLETHPDIFLAGEPFHPNKKKVHGIIKYPETAKEKKNNKKALDRALDNILSKQSGMKHIGAQVSSELNKIILLDPRYKIIFLWRQNFLQQAISNLISMQANQWDSEITKTEFGPIAIDEVMKKVNFHKRLVKRCKRILSGREFLELKYEDLYGGDEQQRLAKIEEILTFIGYSIDEDSLPKIKELLDPKNKVNSEKTYRLIPNIVEIDKKVGSKENGYLFKEGIT